MLTAKKYHIHFVGAGGIGMSGIAELLINLGYTISGSDIRQNASVKRLEKLGAKIFIGHRAENIGGCDVLVYSSAVTRENPEVRAALDRAIPIIPRAEMLAELMRMKYSVCVGGSHGKTSTSSMLATVLADAGLDPTMIIGGILKSIGSNAKLGKSDYLVAESDESDGSFLKLYPTVAIVTNIDREHIQHYGSMKKLKRAFVEFVNRVPFYGLGVLCFDHPNVQAIIPAVEKRFVTYGFSGQADYRATSVRINGVGSEFSVWYCREKLGDVSLKMMGEHNVLNALAVIAAADEIGVKFESIKRSLASFEGIGRRFEIVAEPKGITIVDDYGHHPSEIKETIKSASRHLKRRIIAVFQPHRYTRTQDLMSRFAKAFDLADIVVVTEIYPAGEKPIRGVTAKALARLIGKRGRSLVEYIASLDDIPPRLLKIVREGDVVITFGAGDVNKVCGKLATLIEGELK
ncbi:MAG: UDP-N-acetylmuramate--L-alanine ligase [Myxococcota bacterium]